MSTRLAKLGRWMESSGTSEFWQRYRELPKPIRQATRQTYRLWSKNARAEVALQKGGMSRMSTRSALYEGQISGADLRRLRFFNMGTLPAINASFLARDHFFNWISRFLAKPSVGYDSE